MFYNNRASAFNPDKPASQKTDAKRARTRALHPCCEIAPETENAPKTALEADLSLEAFLADVMARDAAQINALLAQIAAADEEHRAFIQRVIEDDTAILARVLADVCASERIDTLMDSARPHRHERPAFSV